MDADSEQDERQDGKASNATLEHVRCPNCGTLNPPDTLICNSCGVNIVRFDAALPQMQELQAAYADRHNAQLASEHATQVDAEVEQEKARFRMQVRWLLIVSAVLVVLGTLFVFGYARYVERRRERRLALYDEGMSCLQNKQYACALENLEQVAREKLDDPELREALRQTRIALWDRAVEDEDWGRAIALMEANLSADPADAQSARLRRQAYQRWLDSARENRRWLTYLWILVRRRLQKPRTSGLLRARTYGLG